MAGNHSSGHTTKAEPVVVNPLYPELKLNPELVARPIEKRASQKRAIPQWDPAALAHSMLDKMEAGGRLHDKNKK